MKQMQVRPHSRFCFDSVWILSRIVFQNVFADIDANNIIALCSCLVFDEKSEDPITNNLDLMKAFETCKGIARNVAEIMARVSEDQTFPYTSNNPQLKMIEDAGNCWKSC